MGPDAVAGLLRNAAALAVVGRGVRSSGAENALYAILARFSLPCVATWGSADLFPSSYAPCRGILGVFGHASANAAVRQADLVLALGTSLNLTHTGTDRARFAPAAKILAVDIDPNQLAYGTCRINMPITADLRAFLDDLARA